MASDKAKQAARAYHMYVWYDSLAYIAVAQARSVDEARALVLPEIGGGDGSCPEREKASKCVRETTPVIWHGANAEFVLTDSAEQREQADFYEKKLAAADRYALERQKPLRDAAQAVYDERDTIEGVEQAEGGIVDHKLWDALRDQLERLG